MESLKSKIRSVPDFPKAGILFYDITTLLRDRDGFQDDDRRARASRSKRRTIDLVVGVESRGFILGGAVADRLGAGFAPVRKKGKLPSKTVQETYDLEYGTDCLEIHADAVEPGQRVLIIDDVLATGGTAAATTALVRKLGGDVQALAFLVELEFLNGRSKLGERDGLQRPEILLMIALLAGAAIGLRAVAHRRRAAAAASRGHASAAAGDVCAGSCRRSAGPETAARLVPARADEPEAVSRRVQRAGRRRRRSISVHQGAAEGGARAVQLGLARVGARPRRRVLAEDGAGAGRDRPRTARPRRCLRTRLAAVEQQKLERYQQRYEEYIKTAKAIAAYADSDGGT